MASKSEEQKESKFNFTSFKPESVDSVEKVYKIKFTNVAESSKANYHNRLKTIFELSPRQNMKYILKHPKEIYALLMKRYNNSCATVANCITAITKIFSSHPQLTLMYPKTYQTWREYLTACREKRNEEYNNNEASDKQKDKIVTMEEIKSKYATLKSDTTTHAAIKSHMQWLLLSCMINLIPKRADLGNVRIFHVMSQNLPTDINFMVLTPTTNFLQLNKFKTAKHMDNGIREEIPDALKQDILMSLKMYPRKYLIVDTKGNPFTKNNSYSTFVMRTYKELFGRSMGVSMWRHIWVTTQLDLHRMPEKVIKDAVQKMGTSEHQIKQVYKWVNIDNDASAPSSTKGIPQICTTVCKPISTIVSK
jgi:hypothetical protein